MKARLYSRMFVSHFMWRAFGSHTSSSRVFVGVSLRCVRPFSDSVLVPGYVAAFAVERDRVYRVLRFQFCDGWPIPNTEMRVVFANRSGNNSRRCV